MAGETDRFPENRLQSAAVDSKTIAYFGFDDYPVAGYYLAIQSFP